MAFAAWFLKSTSSRMSGARADPISLEASQIFLRLAGSVSVFKISKIHFQKVSSHPQQGGNLHRLELERPL